ncbi:hypothetical protein Patl1_36202 [Pistacia atlantica]|nr:hypothetical protein Patl1_36202 [Pistacia atlantica]
MDLTTLGLRRPLPRLITAQISPTKSSSADPITGTSASTSVTTLSRMLPSTSTTS